MGLLGGSWVVISGAISRVTIVITHIRGRITTLIPTHEPPSRLDPEPQIPKPQTRSPKPCRAFPNKNPQTAQPPAATADLFQPPPLIKPSQSPYTREISRRTPKKALKCPRKQKSPQNPPGSKKALKMPKEEMPEERLPDESSPQLRATSAGCEGPAC